MAEDSAPSSVLDYRSSVHPRPSFLSTLGWAIYLGMSWTWCIGMFLPVLLIRDFGGWGFVVFAVPNVIGAAAMGWVVRSPQHSERMQAAHFRLMVAFSCITVAFQIFFAWWMLPMYWAIPVLVAGVLFMNGPMMIKVRGAQEVLAAGTLAVSCVCIARSLSFGGRLAWNHLTWRATPGTAALALVCIFGFGLCPYLDLTFQHARQRMARAQSRAAFAVGFGGFFLLMIMYTLIYTLQRVPPELFIWTVAIHMSVQLAFTMGMHWYHGAFLASSRLPGKVALIWVPMFIGSAIGVAAFVMRWRHITSGEIFYRLFMSFYGVIFPAYVWICITPTWREPMSPTRRQWIVLAIAVAFAAPFYWVAFIQGRMFWVVPGVLLVLAARFAVPKRVVTA